MGLGAVADAVTSIADVFTHLGKMIEYLIYGLFELLPSFVYILNPVNLVNDSITGVFLSIKIIITNIIGFLTPKKKKYNKCKDSGGGIFGFRRTRNSQGKLVQDQKCGKEKTCKRNSILKYIIAVLCPPLSLFLHMGVSGWFHITICAILTVYAYYFPGLIYTILHISNIIYY